MTEYIFCGGMYSDVIHPTLKAHSLYCPKVLRFLSVCFANQEKNADQHPDELILLLIALGLDPNMIDGGLNTHIGACISRILTWYSTDEDFMQVMMIKWWVV